MVNRRQRTGEGFCVLVRSDCSRDAGPSWQERDETGTKKTRQADPQIYHSSSKAYGRCGRVWWRGIAHYGDWGEADAAPVLQQ